ncbi:MULTISPECIES: glycosyltransferase family 2 protein [unclassified Bradyrhizobium]|uniref:glycosyltransferase family 2 protein n=1 Tax=unclassified Bradyrhizobium TaxID=2631580 RepID=UPI00291675FD|nr:MULTISPECIES: glycosyltransferase family 2 protein [unclassified Bradyrhizobium]
MPDIYPQLTIFIPCYNEAPVIQLVLREIAECMPATGVSFEVIVIDDGSTDGSSAVVKEFCGTYPELALTIVENGVNKGISCNFTDAAFLGRGEYFCRMGGHFQDRRDALIPLVSRIGQADLVIGYLDDDRRNPFRRYLSKLFTTVANAASGYDIRYYLGMVIFRCTDVLRWHSYRHQAFQAELLTRVLASGRSYVQVPIRAHQRNTGRSRAISLTNALSVIFCLADILGMRLRSRRMRRQRRRAEAGVQISAPLCARDHASAGFEQYS